MRSCLEQHISRFFCLKEPLRANARQYFYMPYGWVRVGTSMREYEVVSNSICPDFFVSRKSYVRMCANIFTHPWDGSGLGPVCANAQLSRTAHIRIFLPLGTLTRECAPIFSHALGMGQGWDQYARMRSCLEQHMSRFFCL